MVLSDVLEIGFAEIDGLFCAALGSAELQIQCIDCIGLASKVEGAAQAHRRFQCQLRREADENFVRSRWCSSLVIDERYRSIGVQLDPVRAGGEREDGTISKRDVEFALALGFDQPDFIAASCFESEIEIDCFFKPRPL